MFFIVAESLASSETPFITRLGGFGNHFLQSPALCVHHFVERVGNLIKNSPKIVLIKDFAVAITEAIKHLADAFHVASVSVRHSTPHDPAQCTVDIAVIQQVVSQLVKEAIGINIKPALSAVPRRVPEVRRLATTTAATPTENHGETLTH